MREEKSKYDKLFFKLIATSKLNDAELKTINEYVVLLEKENKRLKIKKEKSNVEKTENARLKTRVKKLNTELVQAKELLKSAHEINLDYLKQIRNLKERNIKL